jgi:prevent-host-death family protein
METVSKSELKARMLEYFRRVEKTGEELVVTSHGKPVARVVPYRQKVSVAELFKDLRGKVVYRADILEPTTDEWSDY